MQKKKKNNRGIVLLQATLRICAAGVRSVEEPEGPPRQSFASSPARMLPSGVYGECSCPADCCASGRGRGFGLPEGLAVGPCKLGHGAALETDAGGREMSF